MECEQAIVQEGYQATLRNAFAKQYSEGSDEWTNDDEMRCVPSIVQGVLKLGASTALLDLGCGAGHDAEYFAGIFSSVTGMDIYDHEAWKGISARHTNVKFICGDVLEKGVPGKFDLIIDNGCFHHQHPERHQEYLALASSFLTDGGTFVLTTFKNDSIEQRVDANGRIHRYFRDSELKSELAKAGFQEFERLDVYRRRKGDYYRISFARAVGRGSAA
jgi:EEF1A lysine methyltransferase 2